MKRYLQKVDSDYNAFLAKMNASGSHPLTLAMGGEMIYFMETVLV